MQFVLCRPIVRCFLLFASCVSYTASTLAQSAPERIDCEHAVQSICTLPTGVVLLGGNGLTRLDNFQPTQTLQLDAHRLKIASAQATSAGLLIGGVAGVEYGFVASLGDDLSSMRWLADELDSRVICIAAVDQFVVAGCENGHVLCLCAKDGTLVWNQPSHAKMVTCIDVSGGGTVASGDWTGKIVISRLANGEAIHTMPQHRDRITGLSFQATSQDSEQTRLYSSSRDGTVRLWYPEQRRLVRFVQLPTAVTHFTVLAQDQLVAFLGNHRAATVDLSTAEIVGNRPSPAGYVTASSVHGQKLILGDGSKHATVVEVDMFLRDFQAP